ncbi:hypothetical protein B0H10DRAFT_2338955 [Mycena sp. CBHHK59/15]|nr:hypothetical protein B0H10DRAFT_2338955 [Mycena sp. CBHHK59/15]
MAKERLVLGELLGELSEARLCHGYSEKPTHSESEPSKERWLRKEEARVIRLIPAIDLDIANYLGARGNVRLTCIQQPTRMSRRGAELVAFKCYATWRASGAEAKGWQGVPRGKATRRNIATPPRNLGSQWDAARDARTDGIGRGAHPCQPKYIRLAGRQCPAAHKASLHKSRKARRPWLWVGRKYPCMVIGVFSTVLEDLRSRIVLRELGNWRTRLFVELLLHAREAWTRLQAKEMKWATETDVRTDPVDKRRKSRPTSRDWPHVHASSLKRTGCGRPRLHCGCPPPTESQCSYAIDRRPKRARRRRLRATHGYALTEGGAAVDLTDCFVVRRTCLLRQSWAWHTIGRATRSGVRDGENGRRHAETKADSTGVAGGLENASSRLHHRRDSRILNVIRFMVWQTPCYEIAPRVDVFTPRFKLRQNTVARLSTPLCFSFLTSPPVCLITEIRSEYPKEFAPALSITIRHPARPEGEDGKGTCE